MLGRNSPSENDHEASRYQRCCRVEGDVVAHGAALGLCCHLLTAVGEVDRAREPVAAIGTVGEVPEDLREAQLEPALVGVPADRQVAEELTRLAVGADEEALGLPPLPPGGLGQAGSIEVVTGLGETGTSPEMRLGPQRGVVRPPPASPGGAGGAGASRKAPDGSGSRGARRRGW